MDILKTIVYIVILLTGICRIERHKTLVVVDYVDVIELNHCYDMQGKIRFDQLIFWEILNGDDKPIFVVVDWKNIVNGREKLTDEEFRIKNKEFQAEWFAKYGVLSNGFMPEYNPKWLGIPNCRLYKSSTTGHSDLYNLLLYDSRGNGSTGLRKIISKSYIETWTQYDPERENFAEFPLFERKILQKFHLTDR